MVQPNAAGGLRREFEASYPRRPGAAGDVRAAAGRAMFEPVAGIAMIDRRRVEICRALISHPSYCCWTSPRQG